MFWRKCGKLMVNPDGKLSNCPECPCGYYGLFVLEYYMHSLDNRPSGTEIYRCPGDPKLDWLYSDFCFKRIVVFPAHVVDNELKPYQYAYNVGGMPIGFDRYTCIPISRQAQPDGTVADDQELELEYYMTCDYTSNPPVYAKIDYLVHIYRIGDCFDNYDDFAIFFYSGCGVLPDAMTGKFPDIFGTVNWDGVWYETATRDAANCINTSWNTYADKLYRPRCVVHLTNHSFSYNFYPTHKLKEHTGAPADGGTPGVYGMHIVNRYCENGPDGAQYVVDYEIGTEHWCPSCNSPWGAWYFSCCDWWDGSVPALDSVNSWDAAAVDDDTKYCVDFSDTGGDNITTIPGTSRPMCATCTTEAYYGSYIMSYNNFRWRQRQYCVLSIEKTNDTPENATGIVCCILAYSQKTNDEYCIEKDKIEYVYNQDIVTFKFDTEYRFPTCDNIKPWIFLNERSDCVDVCVDNGANGDDPNVGPHGWHETTEFFYTRLAVIRYSFE